MQTIRKKTFDNPDTSIPKMSNTMVDLEDGVFILKQIAEPGWVWSECVKPKVGTDSCQKRHIGLCVAGRLAVSNVDGSATEIGPGEAYVIEPGHNARVIGEENWECYEFHPDTAKTYGKN